MKREPKKTPVRVVVADDHPVYRQGLVDAIRQNPGLELVGQAETGAQALEEIRRLKPDVAVVDMKMPELDGIELVEVIAREQLESRVLLLSGYLESGTIYRALEAGARGFLSKDSGSEAIRDAILAVSEGEMVLGPKTQDAIGREIRLRAPGGTSTLSRREREILSLIAKGLPVSEVANRLYLSPATVKTHLQRIYRKLGVSDRAAAVAEALRRGLLD
jgi:two-component system, NarL family, nitrate/nitrite response regulator NarL